MEFAFESAQHTFSAFTWETKNKAIVFINIFTDKTCSKLVKKYGFY